MPLRIEKDGFSLHIEPVALAPLAPLIQLGFVEAVKNGVVRNSEMLFPPGKIRSR